ncbi:MAG TPA: VCBS repeat-containing protein, partial [Gemmatimonadaceae bacterium]|nr:VCBS repeat-containing protein [Gemmatimonadaceae bacterium]
MRCAAVAVVVTMAACRRAPDVPPLFEQLSPAATGVTFVNRLPESPDFNILNYLYYYNGGGVAAGDVNGDGLPDLYFTANVGPNRLYLNRGNYRFEDVTDRAGVADSIGWKTGVTMADVNGDGLLDIYVSGVDDHAMHGRNVLYINNGDGTFTDRAAAYGLAFAGYSTQALFFDYDGDGDLDVYLLNHGTHAERAGGDVPDSSAHAASGDRLYRNDGGHFVDVTDAAGVRDRANGFGLGVVATDVNLDGCPDLYVANDFQENDLLYVNNCNGTFTESLASAAGHTSRYSMGVDAADVDGDGRPDLFVADMLPDREDILKRSASTDSWALSDLRLRAGYQPQYAQNTLQLNRGGGKFSEVGYLAGVFATDWSWAPLFADLDNDGRLDLFVTSGIYRRPNDLDYIDYVDNAAVQASLANGAPAPQVYRSLLERMPQVPAPNHAFRNEGDLRFTDMAPAWGLAQPGFSNGAVYVDLNNGGALDLVVSHIDAPASIYRNHARERNGNAYLTVMLHGAGANTEGIGARVIVVHQGARQMLEQMPTRGFESSVDHRLHFGLGRATRVDSLTVIWPDRWVQVLTDVPVNRTLTLSQRDAHPSPRPLSHAPHPTFSSVELSVPYQHIESSFADYDREPLIPHLLSRQGPALAVADVNGDGLDDIYAGGAKWQPGRLLLQQRDGSFRVSPPAGEAAFAADSLSEDVDAAFFDANGDGLPDLYVVSAGNEFWGNADALRGRLYINDGQGRFHRATDALPAIFENGSCVVPGDFNGDGHVDLFLGSRVVSRQYGLTPHSHLLENDGRGHFVDVTAAKAPGLADAGMVTSAAWIDYDGDGKLDLVVAGEWMPVRVFHQEQGRLVERTTEAGFAGTEGWWNSVTAVDLDGDGRQDLVLGNLGLNSYLRASAAEPARMYVGDFGHDGTLEQLITIYKHGVSYPLADRDQLVKLIPSLRSRYPTHASFGASRLEDIFPAADLKHAKVLQARLFASVVALNDGHGRFSIHPLPTEAQLAPVNAVVARDFDGDGRVDLLLAGNDYSMTPMLGRGDASYGLLLHGIGDGRFQPVDLEHSGVSIEGQVRHMQPLRAAGGGERTGQLIVIARNNDRLQFLRASGARDSRP